MKVKWTTITEDESTWPPQSRFSIVGGNIISLVLKMCSKNTYLIYTHSSLGYENGNIKELFGIKWRPMPKPPKHKKTNTLDLLRSELSEMVDKNMEKISAISSCARGNISPWRSTESPPSSGDLIIMRTYDGLITYAHWFQYQTNLKHPVLSYKEFKKYSQWMEIPL